MIDANRSFARASRGLARLAIVLGVAVSLLSPRPAAAMDPPSWNIRYLSGYGFLPNPPVSQEDTRFLLYGWFPFDCGQVSNARVIDAEHIELTLDPGPACSDTLRTWSHLFDLGMLATGNHSLEITLTMNRPDSGQAIEHGSFEFGVEDSTAPPPPPPPPSGFMPYVLHYLFDPAPPNIFQPTHVDLLGWFPYTCGEVADARVVDSDDIELTLRPGPACSDTASWWRQGFDLGLLAAGAHDLNVRLTLQTPGLPDSVATGVLSFAVSDTATPPPPGPPGDSLNQVLSNSRPNPFAAETRFGVSMDQPTTGEVAIFDISGRRVVTLFHGELPRGTSQFTWNGRRSSGEFAPGGIYFYRLTARGRVIAKRVVLLGKP